MTKLGTIAAINRYPVKSMQGEAPDQVELDADGIVGDRTWALRDVESDKLVSAKRPRLWRAMLDCRATGTGSEVTVALPDGTSFDIADPKLPVALGELFGREVTIEEAEVPQQGSYASDWPEIEGLSLAGPIDLPTNLTGAGRSFIDVEVLHLLTTASLSALGQVGPDGSADPRRFRPSILIDTPDLDGFAEDEWTGRRLVIGEVELAVGDPTPRCIMTTVEQEGVAAEPGVLRSLAEHHRVSNPLGTFACLGSYASVTTPGVVRVGDPVELT
jgi:uncharacterized protein